MISLRFPHNSDRKKKNMSRRAEDQEEGKDDDQEQSQTLLTASDVATCLNACHESSVVALPPSFFLRHQNHSRPLRPNAKSHPPDENDNEKRDTNDIWIGRVDQLAKALGVVRFSKCASQEVLTSSRTVTTKRGALLGKTLEGFGEGGGGGEQNNKSETTEKNTPDEMEESRNNNSASSSRRSSMDLAFRNLRMTPPPLTTTSATTAPLSSMTHQYSHQSTPNLTTAHNQSSSSLSPVKAKTATMTSQSRPTTPTPGENERDEELGSRSLYSFYVVLKAIHEVVTSAPSEPMTTSASTSFAENNNNDSSNGGGGNKVSSNVDNNRSSSSTHSSMNETSSGNGTTTTENKESSALKYMVVIPGSGGVAGDTLRYVRRFASMGHVVIAPDDMAWPMHLRYRPRKDLREDSAAEEENEITKEEDSYWNDFALYDVATDATTGAKQSASGSLVYKSSAKSFIEDSFLKKQYDAALKLKSVVVSHILLTLPDFIKNAGVALVGNSEGAAVLGMLNDKTFMNNYATASSKSVVKARIAIAYPFEPSYFTDGLKGWFAGTFGSSWSSNCPVLCINGSEDEFFGPLSSVASDVVSAKRLSMDGQEKEVMEKNYSGDASIALEKLAAQHRAKNQGQSNLLSVIVVGAKHGILKSHDAMVSKLLRKFLRAPQKCLKSVVDAFSEEVVDYTITSNGSVGKLILETKKVKTNALRSSLYDAAA